MNVTIQKVYSGCTLKWWAAGTWQGGQWVILDTDKSSKRLTDKMKAHGHLVTIDKR